MDGFEMARFSVSLPDWFHERLVLWAWFKGTNRATLASQLIQKRIEGNWDQIEKKLHTIADERGVTFEELKAEILKKSQE